jgi:hypothetical protein
MSKNEFGGTMDVRRKRSVSWASAATILLGLMICLGWAAKQAAAQTAGEGSIVGTIVDTTGAAITNAKITATNTATGIATERVSSSAGYFAITPLPPGTYNVEVKAGGFKTFLQENLVLDALQTLALNPVLSVGTATQTVTVTAAPPVLHTEDATLGLTMENENYTNLPILMNGVQRDPTAFGALTPGATTGSARLPIINGTGNYLGQLYLDGMPAETVSQQGDNRLISESMNMDAVDQFQLVTSSPPAEYMGAGAENFTMKSGGLKYHGQVSNFVRNTVFDSWAFTAKGTTVANAQGVQVPAPKAVEHQDELSASAGGVVPRTAHKLFFFVAYDKFHYRHQTNPQLYTIPTTLMTQGDFTELNGGVGSGGLTGEALTGAGANPPFLYDPTTSACTGTSCTRSPFIVAKGGVPTYNIIPANEISPIAQAMQQWLPAPSNPGTLTNNYLGSIPQGVDNHVIDWRVDFDLSSRQRLSSEGVMGTYGYFNNWGSPYLPMPYVGGDQAAIYPKDYVIGDTFTVTPNVVNQLKYSYTRFFQNIHGNTNGITEYEPATLGITNLPAGQAGVSFPGASFGTTKAFGTALQTWDGSAGSVSTQLTTPNNYAVTDNLQWLKGKHSVTMGATFQWEEINNANPATYTGLLDLAYNAYSTANFGAGTNTLTTGTAAAASGYAYASYLLGAVGGSTGGTGSPTLNLQPVSEEGGRYKTFAPYYEDSYKLTRKLTLDIGLRWDYLPPYHEVENRWTFLNPTLTNGITGTPGMLEFAGSVGGGSPVSCNCKTPVQTYWKNFGPRVAMAYELNPKTVLRAGFAQVFSQGGGVGGRGGAYQGTGQTGFNMSAIGPAEATTGGLAVGPSFYLNNSTFFATAGAGGANIQNTDLFGKGYVYPAPPTPGLAAQELNTGFYLAGQTPTTQGTGAFVSAAGVNYADPYVAGRAPELVMFNAGIERALTSTTTLAVNYVGNESHFLINSTNSGTGNARGYWNNQLDPRYYAALGPIETAAGTPLLTAQATAANIALVQAALPTFTPPAFYKTAGAASSKATIVQMLTAFPQYSTVADTWGNVDNFSYHSVQITVNQRLSHGLTFNVNYTFSKNIGDDGTFRSGFDIPAAALSNNGGINPPHSWHQDRIERSWTTISAPQSIHAFGVYRLPFGQGHIGSNSRAVRVLAGGWQLSGIYHFDSGTPMGVTWSGCSATSYPGQSQCMPDLNPSYASKSARINGSWGKGPNGFNECNLGIATVSQPTCTAIPYVDSNAFQPPQNFYTGAGVNTGINMLGTAPRTRAMELRNPHTWDLDTGLQRTFPIHNDLKFVFEADCTNTWNNVVFGGPGGSYGAGTFGKITGVSNSPRDFQFAGHLNF